ncbi:hypothetical protein HPB47_007924 [Ixodes persulcatus]|uniref:Uncharacterized protein n=1 Tax=Ixodes persulcatus TaxID=34615 RepID=A0AC60P6L9_IXOPE|nr:hypothetical protein HPB47_007924 [Ixodes persulcatus]
MAASTLAQAAELIQTPWSPKKRTPGSRPQSGHTAEPVGERSSAAPRVDPGRSRCLDLPALIDVVAAAAFHHSEIMHLFNLANIDGAAPPDHRRRVVHHPEPLGEAGEKKPGHAVCPTTLYSGAPTPRGSFRFAGGTDRGLAAFRPRVTLHRGCWSTKGGTGFGRADLAKLPCVATGHPPPKYRWYKLTGSQIHPVVASRKVQEVDGTLVFRQASLHDSGKYVCIASNSLGQDRADRELVVTG